MLFAWHVAGTCLPGDLNDLNFSEGDNVLGSVRPSVPLSRLNRLTYDLDQSKVFVCVSIISRRSAFNWQGGLTLTLAWMGLKVKV